MASAREYMIQFGNLGPGEHEFEFEIKDTFFQQIENSVIRGGQVDVLVVLDKKDNMLLLDFTMNGEVTVSCDRCLEDLTLELESFNELIVKFGEHEEEESEDVLMLPAKAYELDITQYLYEYISVMIPIRNVHEDENGNPSCDPEVLRELGKFMGAPEGADPTDPRWDILKNFNPN